MKKIILTGGHFTPGLAIIPELKRKGWQVYWLGEERAVIGTKIKTIEARILPGLKIPFYAVTTTKFSRDSLLSVFLNIWKLPLGFFQSLVILLQIQPQIILSFGSYVSIPIAVAGFLLGIPIVVHEQTAASGLANRIVAKFAKFIVISFETSSKYFAREKTCLIGNLVRSEIYKIAEERKNRKENTMPVLFITGGSRGSQPINKTVFEIIDKLTKIFVVYHQTGVLDLPRAEKVKKEITNPKNYIVFDSLTPTEFGERLKQADLIVARAGANTVSEIAVCGIPAIFIPLPFAGSDEQTKNAELLKKAGLAEILRQSQLSGANLLEIINNVYGKIDTYRKFASNASRLVPRDASQKLVSRIEKAI